MLTNLQALWNDEQGFIISIELILIATIAVLGLIVGMSCLASAVVAEYQDLGFAVRSLNQSFFFGGFRGCKAWVPGSSYVNRPYSNGVPVLNDTWELGLGSYGSASASPGYVAPQAGTVVTPHSTTQQPTDCPPLAPSTRIVPCPSGDCAAEKVIPGAPLSPVPEHSLPRSSPVPPRLEVPAPVLPRIE